MFVRDPWGIQEVWENFLDGVPGPDDVHFWAAGWTKVFRTSQFFDQMHGSGHTLEVVRRRAASFEWACRHEFAELYAPRPWNYAPRLWDYAPRPWN